MSRSRMPRSLANTASLRLAISFAICLLACAVDGIAIDGVSQPPPVASPCQQLTQPASDPPSDPRGPTYAGDQACASCHADYSSTYRKTNHSLNSSLPSSQSILGSFAEPTNTVVIEKPAPVIGDPGLSYQMTKEMTGKGNCFLETAITGFPGKWESHTESIDLVIGSGVRGQTFLYWHGDQLFELPISDWSDGHLWINSPGYRNGPPVFNRPAQHRCLECHVSYIKPLTADAHDNAYDKSTLLTGISCETCHGPAAAHVAARQTTKTQTAKSPDPTILNPKTFARDRQIDLCSLCHSGAQQQPLDSAFSYKPGTPLESYLRPQPGAGDDHPDVHANQVGLLKKSRCFQSSPTMTCSTCHQVHAPERTAASYSDKCLSCHKVESCGMEKKLGPGIKSNCIDCHMPLQQTDAIVSQTANRVIRTSMRTHWIRPYPAYPGDSAN